MDIKSQVWQNNNGKIFIDDDKYSNFFPIVDPKVQALNDLKSKYDNIINNALNSLDCVTLNSLLFQINTYAKPKAPTFCIYRPQGKCTYDDYSPELKAITEYTNDLSSKCNNCINTIRGLWSIDNSKRNDCHYLIDRVTSLADRIGKEADAENKIGSLINNGGNFILNGIVNNGQKTDGRISKTLKEVLDTYTQAIKDVNCEEKLKQEQIAKDDATDDIKKLMEERKKAKEDEEARLKQLQEPKVEQVVKSENKLVDIKTLSDAPTTDNSKIVIAVVGIALLSFLLIK